MCFENSTKTQTQLLGPVKIIATPVCSCWPQFQAIFKVISLWKISSLFPLPAYGYWKDLEFNFRFPTTCPPHLFTLGIISQHNSLHLFMLIYFKSVRHNRLSYSIEELIFSKSYLLFFEGFRLFIYLIRNLIQFLPVLLLQFKLLLNFCSCWAVGFTLLSWNAYL